MSNSVSNLESLVSDLKTLVAEKKWFSAYELIQQQFRPNKFGNGKSFITELDWPLLDQLSMICYYVQDYQLSSQYYQQLLSHPNLPHREYMRIINNFKFTAQQLIKDPNYPQQYWLKVYCEQGGTSAYFYEHALALTIFLISAGFLVQFVQTPLEELPPDPDSVYIFYGLHRMFHKIFPFERYICYNMEHWYSMWEHDFYKNNPYMFQRLTAFSAKKSLIMWDFSRINQHYYPNLTPHIQYLPLAVSPIYRFDTLLDIYQQQTQSPSQKDIDVLFLGGLNQRRKDILQALRDQGLMVYCEPCWTRNGKAQLHRRAKIVLNLNNAEPVGCNVARMIPALSNLCVIITEVSFPIDDDYLADYVHLANNREELMALCQQYAQDDLTRQQWWLDHLWYLRQKLETDLNYSRFLDMTQLQNWLAPKK